MSNNSGFNFGSVGPNASSNVFGSSSNTPQPSVGGLFGSSTTPSTSSPFGQQPAATSKLAPGGLFGSGSNTPAVSNPFGGSSTGSSQTLFGGLSGTGSTSGSGTSTPNILGGGSSTGNNFGTGIFGGAKPTGTQVTSSGPTFNFGQKNESGASTPPATTQGSGLFSNLGKQPSTGLFGKPSVNASTSAPSGLSTPATSKFFGGTSTTPAGPPPTDNSQGSNPNANNPFGSNVKPISEGMFGAAKPPESGQTSAAPSLLFPGTGGTGASAFSTKPAGGLSLFSNLNSKTSTSSAASGTSTTLSSDAPKPSFQQSTPASTSGTQPTTAAPSSSNLFSSQQPVSSAPATSDAPTSTFFGGNPTSSSSVPASTSGLFGSAPASTTATSGGLFPSLGGAVTSGAAASGTSAPSTTATPQPAPSLFGLKPTTTTSQVSSSSAPTTSATAPTISGAVNAANNSAPSGLGASTAGPTPQMNRLKNKTMDEIITRWASDLSKYQKEFQEQAKKVATWDRLMVENGEKIQKLYLSTFEAERQSAEIERQLANVESQQEELAAWLDRYEGDVDEMFSRQVGQGETLQGPDQERERTYKLAEKLTDRLDDMGKNLTGMIEAVNEASTTLSKTSKADDPLAHIVKVLNSHLSQLQWIDENAMVLQAKVTEAQKTGQSIGANGYGGPESEAADSFYRSFTGKK